MKESCQQLLSLVQAQVAKLDALTNEVKALRQDVAVSNAPRGAAVDVKTTALMLGCGRTRVFELLKAGRLKAAPKVGRQKMVTRSSVDSVVTGEAAAQRPPRAKQIDPRQDLGSAIMRLPL